MAVISLLSVLSAEPQVQCDVWHSGLTPASEIDSAEYVCSLGVTFSFDVRINTEAQKSAERRIFASFHTQTVLCRCDPT